MQAELKNYKNRIKKIKNNITFNSIYKEHVQKRSLSIIWAKFIHDKLWLPKKFTEMI